MKDLMTHSRIKHNIKLFKATLSCAAAMTPLPLKWGELSEEDKELNETNNEPGINTDFIRYENGVALTRYYAQFMADRIYNLEVRADDIWVVSYPKTGTTLTLEMVWMIVNGEVSNSMPETIF